MPRPDPRTLLPIELDPSEHDPDERAQHKRLKRLSEQRDHRGYTLWQPPQPCRALDLLDDEDDDTPVAIEKAFDREMVERKPEQKAAGRAGSYRQSARHLGESSADDRRLCWLAHRMLVVSARRSELMNARPLLSEAHETVRDPAWQHLLRCELARMYEERGELDEAEAWLAACDSKPPLIELDSAYRTGMAALAARRGHYGDVLALVGDAPLARAYEAVGKLLRVVGYEGLGKRYHADDELEALVETHLVVDLHRLIAERPALKACKHAWERFCDKKEIEAAAKRKAAMRRAGAWSAVGLIGIPIGIGVFSSGTVSKLICQRKDGGATPPCRIEKSLMGSHHETVPIQTLRGARVDTSGSGKNETSELWVTTTNGSIELYSCSKCSDGAHRDAKRIEAFVQNSNIGYLTVGGGANPAPYIGIAFAMTALALIGLGIIGTIKALAIRSTLPRH